MMNRVDFRLTHKKKKRLQFATQFRQNMDFHDPIAKHLVYLGRAPRSPRGFRRIAKRVHVHIIRIRRARTVRFLFRATSVFAPSRYAFPIESDFCADIAHSSRLVAAMKNAMHRRKEGGEEEGACDDSPPGV